jgi:hypothetical protein
VFDTGGLSLQLQSFRSRQRSPAFARVANHLVLGGDLSAFFTFKVMSYGIGTSSNFQPGVPGSLRFVGSGSIWKPKEDANQIRLGRSAVGAVEEQNRSSVRVFLNREPRRLTN